MPTPASKSSTTIDDARKRRRAAGRAASRAAARSGSGNKRTVWIAAGAIAVVLIAMIVVRNFTNAGQAEAGVDVAAPATVLDPLTTTPPGNFDAVGKGTAGMPVAVRGTPMRDQAGHLIVLYVGAEYCPFCAAERWPLIAALSRFGQFSGLKQSRSAADDVFPSTPTFTFVGASYTSQSIAFQSVELQGNTRVGGQYPRIQTPTPAQDQVFKTYDSPPYVAQGQAGSIPFLDMGGQFIVSGSSYDPSVLKGRTWESIATDLNNPSSPTAQAILGTANVLTAAICSGLGQTTEPACATPAVQTLMGALAQIPPAAPPR